MGESVGGERSHPEERITSGTPPPQRDTASRTQARTRSPRGMYPSEHSTPSGIQRAGRRQGREAPEGCIQASTAPPAGYSEQDASKGGKASEGGIPACTPHPQRDTASRTQARAGRPPRDVSQRAQHPPAGYSEQDTGKVGGRYKEGRRKVGGR